MSQFPSPLVLPDFAFLPKSLTMLRGARESEVCLLFTIYTTLTTNTLIQFRDFEKYAPKYL